MSDLVCDGAKNELRCCSLSLSLTVWMELSGLSAQASQLSQWNYINTLLIVGQYTSMYSSVASMYNR